MGHLGVLRRKVMIEETTPNHTLYVNNLNEKIKLDDMKQTLKDIFEKFGEVLEVIAKKNIKMRGQAFVIFRNLKDAANAKNGLVGTSLYHKELKIRFAKEKSDVVAQLEGTFVKKSRPGY